MKANKNTVKKIGIGIAAFLALMCLGFIFSSVIGHGKLMMDMILTLYILLVTIIQSLYLVVVAALIYVLLKIKVT